MRCAGPLTVISEGHKYGIEYGKANKVVCKGVLASRKKKSEENVEKYIFYFEQNGISFIYKYR